jgi:hypothetical protein
MCVFDRVAARCRAGPYRVDGRPLISGASGVALHLWRCCGARVDKGRVGMQPSRKREGKPAGEGAAGKLGTVGMQPSRKREGKSVGEAGGRHSWDAAIAQARWESAEEGAGNTVGMPPPKGGGKPAGEGDREIGHSWDAAAAQGRRETGRSARGDSG